MYLYIVLQANCRKEDLKKKILLRVLNQLRVFPSAGDNLRQPHEGLRQIYSEKDFLNIEGNLIFPHDNKMFYFLKDLFLGPWIYL